MTSSIIPHPPQKERITRFGTANPRFHRFASSFTKEIYDAADPMCLRWSKLLLLFQISG
jgi:hypothetical protein